MININSIKEYTDKIAQIFNPDKIILFGSYARNEPGPDSDVDLLVIMNYPGRAVEQSYKIRKNIRPEFPVDLIVRKNKIIEERIKEGDFFLKEIIETGRILYEKTGN